jgi:hypothetical protein
MRIVSVPLFPIESVVRTVKLNFPSGASQPHCHDGVPGTQDIASSGRRRYSTNRRRFCGRSMPTRELRNGRGRPRRRRRKKCQLTIPRSMATREKPTLPRSDRSSVWYHRWCGHRRRAHCSTCSHVNQHNRVTREDAARLLGAIAIGQQGRRVRTPHFAVWPAPPRRVRLRGRAGCDARSWP